MEPCCTQVNYLKPLTIFAKAPSWIYDWVLNMALEGFVENAPEKELTIAPVISVLQQLLCKSITTVNILI